MKIAILGTRGIPNNYGGFEQFAECLSVLLVRQGHQVTVYNPHFHKYNQESYKGVNIRKIYSPEKYIGASANFLYDYLCLKDALNDNYDVLLECGYHSNAPSYFLMKKRKHPVLITNMDGLEWKRSKWNSLTRWLIKKLEKMAVRKSHYLVSDNIGIYTYYKEQFGVESSCIAYGATPVVTFDEQYIESYGVRKDEYFMLIARLEPENNIETILDGYILSGSKLPFLVVGNYKTQYGTFLRNKYKADNIVFVGSLYSKEKLDSLRYYAKAYFHGHSVGGTNPSLLEAMASKALIVAHDNVFNKAILKENALFFSECHDIANIINSLDEFKNVQNFKRENYQLIKNEYSWEKIATMYEQLFHEAVSTKDI